MVSKKLLVAIAAASTLGMSLSTVAATACNTGCPGVYVGAQAGWGQVSTKIHRAQKNDRHHNDGLRTDGDDRNRSNSSGSLNSDGFAGRLYLGYQWNNYFGLESGVAGFFTSSDFHQNNDRDNNHHNGGHGGLRGGENHHKDKDKNHHTSTNNVGQWDLLARVGTPFGCSGFRGDLRGGVGYLFNGNEHSDSSRFIPVAGASVGYCFCQNIMVDLAYLHGFGSSGSSHHDDKDDHHDHHSRGDNHDNKNSCDDKHDKLNVKSTDLVTIGVSYLFPTM
jgi:hypothetical protein